MKRALMVFFVIVFCIAVAGDVIAYGGVITRDISVSFIPLKYYFDAFEVAPPSDKTGFIYNGTTYVPLRWMCEMLGKEVSWDGSTYSIWVGKQPDGTTVKLSDLELLPSGGSAAWDYVPQGITVLGQSFKQAYRTHANMWWDSTASFFLDGKYSKFEAYFGLDPSLMDYAGSGVLIVKGDGEEIYRVTKSSSEKADPISIDVTGVATLTFELYTAEGFGGDASMFIAEPILVR